MLLGSVLFGADELVAAYVKARLGQSCSGFRDYSALGVVRNGQLCGGVVYHNYVRLPHGNCVEVSFAFDDPRWALPQTLRTICTYPFVQLDCVRVTALIAKRNKRSRKFVEGIGFTREGVHPKGMDGRETAISYGLLRERCRWIKKDEHHHGKERTSPAAHA